LALGAVVQAQSSAHFAGALDDVQVYRCALSAIDVTTIAAGGRATTCRPSLGELGTGCGPGPFELLASGDASLGGDGLLFTMRGGRPGALAYRGIGAGPSQAVSLESFGLFGCTLYAPQPEFAAIGRLDASGSLNAAPLPIPDTPSLSCSPFVLQALGVSPFAIELSNAVAVTPGFLNVASISESFADETYLDREVSSGTWRSGMLTPGVMGGSGRHGSFRHQLGTLLPGSLDTWVIDTGNTTVPRAWTLLQTQDIVVTNGHFEFTDLVVPLGIRVWFRGPHPAVIHVSGRVQILGTLSADGDAPSSNFVPATTTPGVSIAGQAGAPGGAGGGTGGRGADGCDGRGSLPAFTGRRGDDAIAPAGSGYTSVVYSSGGPGGALHPASGLNASITFSYFGQICGMLAGGGGGGSFLGIGSAGVADVSFIPGNTSDLGPSTAPGSLVPFVQRPANVSSLDHFLVAGAGGGGGGSQPLNMLVSEIAAGRHWNAGGGGGGGGGALAMRCGYSLAIASSGRLSARGSGGIAWTNLATPGFGAPSPGGGGSGGSILIQIENPVLFTQGGVLDVTSGSQPSQATLRVSATARSRGGAGGHGAIRFESLGNPTSNLLGIVAGAPNTFTGFVGQLAPTEGDAQSACTSRWRTSRLTAAPRWLHYRISARVRGLPVTWSDDPANYNPADSDSGAVRIWVQGAVVDANGQLLGAPGPWRSYVNGQNGRASLNLDGATGLRFLLVFNRAVEQDVIIRDVDILFAH
ncbi:MAG: hypothetical protein HZB39_11140, partial [Planctomycetes bacterium]|nr:hypothetical protein [Planctomycetota bacterium]